MTDFPHDAITLTGARKNNLKDVTLRIPKGRLTVFTGVSGSGKSSVAFDTIAVESQRQLNETWPPPARSPGAACAPVRRSRTGCGSPPASCGSKAPTGTTCGM